MSILARTPLLRQQLPWARSVHTTAPARSVHDDYHHLPFKFPGDKKGFFAVKVFAYLFTGFSIPFLASAYQLKKAGDGA